MSQPLVPNAHPLQAQKTLPRFLSSCRNASHLLALLGRRTGKVALAEPGLAMYLQAPTRRRHSSLPPPKSRWPDLWTPGGDLGWEVSTTSTQAPSLHLQVGEINFRPSHPLEEGHGSDHGEGMGALRKGGLGEKSSRVQNSPVGSASLHPAQYLAASAFGLTHAQWGQDGDDHRPWGPRVGGRGPGSSHLLAPH